MATLLGRLFRRCHQIRRQPRQVAFPQHQSVPRLVGEHVLRELRAELCQLLHNLCVLGLGLAVEAGPRANEVRVQPFHQADLLRGKPQVQPLGMNGLQTLEQPRDHEHRGAVLRQGPGHGKLHFLQLRRTVGQAQVLEHVLDAGEEAACTIKRDHRVVERGGVRTLRDVLQLRNVLRKGDLESRFVVGGRDGLERGQTELAGPVHEEGVGGCARHGLLLRP
mmetsp:Transcript_23488/g.40543  ORF Transcript_23488/g.40543 Transcript_23488/m.40543 type:complete len:221 (+) Transcript_23488:1569-2231(+)